MKIIYINVINVVFYYVPINQESDYWVDCAELEKKLIEPVSTAQIESLAALYMGELLPGFYEDWIFLERDQLRAAYGQKVLVLIERLSREERWREVEELLGGMGVVTKADRLALAALVGAVRNWREPEPEAWQVP